MVNKHPRMQRESHTIEIMVRLYCHGLHKSNRICTECQQLLDYARDKLDRCPFQEGKTTCAKCPVHCYKPEMRARIRAVMRYSGPKMILRSPLLAIYHLIDGLRKEPVAGLKN
jgi:predicted amidophosphoribosyltransferase